MNTIGRSHGPAAIEAAWRPHDLSADEVLARLGTDREAGLGQEQIAAARSLHGWNALEAAPGVSAWVRLFRQFRSLVIAILVVATGISAALGEVTDAVAIGAIVLLNGLLGFLQEERAARAIAALERLAAPRARVIRGGLRHLLPSVELVPGDLVEMHEGDHVPADARLIQAHSLRAEESALTGESKPVAKNADAVLDPQTELADRSNCVFMGTSIVGGRARAVVTATGMATELGAIAKLLERREPRPSPLQVRMDQLGRVLVVVCLAIIAVIGTLQLLRGGRAFEVFMISVSLAVAAIPEGLPAVVTVALALGLQRMARRNALVRRLPSIETLGCVRVICSDKTGTLTSNEMTVREIMAGDRHYGLTGAGYAPHGSFWRRPIDGEADVPGPEHAPVDPAAEPDLPPLLTAGARCNDARLHREGEGRWRMVGDPTEGALMTAALKGGVPGANEDRQVLFEIPFDAERRTMTVVVREPDGTTAMHVKGAPETILDLCTRARVEGAVLALTDERRREALAAAARMASRALRVLALAHRPDVGEEPSLRHEDLIFLGLVGMMDPPREESATAVRVCRDAGITPVMITGDHAATALSIARELDIARDGDRVVTGHELDTLSDGDLARAVERIRVYARVSAAHKRRVVHAWQQRGSVVAMTGDGANDAPAVQLANVGIAMGRKGTDVTREVADIVLVDDNFASIVAAVEEGRRIFDNIQKFVHYLLATNAGEVLLMFFTALAGWPAPLIATQILWINLVTDGLPALALGVEGAERGIMARPPRAEDTPVISRAEGNWIAVRGLLLAATAALGFALAHGGNPSNLPHARGVAFCVLAYSQLLYSFAFRSRHLTLPQIGPFTNRALLGALGLAGLLQLAAVELPLMQSLFGMSRPLGNDWGLVAVLSLAPVTAVELTKILRQAIRSSAPARR